MPQPTTRAARSHPHEPARAPTAGIDIAKAKLDVALDTGAATVQATNDPAGHQAVARFCRQHGVERVALEATGPYGLGLEAALRREGFAVVVLQPVQVRLFRKMRRAHAKNDRIDAALIARCAALDDTPARPSDPRLGPLAEALTFLEQAEDDITRLKTRRDRYTRPDLKRALESQIARAERAAALLAARLLAELRRQEDLAARLALLVSIPGLGERTALMLVIRLPELGRLTREQIAALVGVAPFDDDTGLTSKPRRIQGGRAGVRCRLYTPTVAAATRWNPDLVRFYQRLTNAGKAPKLALIAAMRKLLAIANAVLARQSPWTSTPRPAH